MAYLVEIARKKKIPVLITNQVYTDFDHRDEVKMVGGDLLRYGSKCLIELKTFHNCRGTHPQETPFTAGRSGSQVQDCAERDGGSLMDPRLSDHIDDRFESQIRSGGAA